MGLTKSEIFTDHQNDIARIAKVLGHPARVAILQHLMKMKMCICGDLVDQIGLAQPTISQHLKVLKTVGLIKGDIEGTSVCYCLSEEGAKAIDTFFLPFIKNLTATTNQTCC